MGNRAVITLQDNKHVHHPVAIYVHWHGGLESVLAFVEYTWQMFPRGRDDLFTLCQVIGCFFPDGLSLYAYPLDSADDVAEGCDNGLFRVEVSAKGVTILGVKPENIAEARLHEYWTREHSIQKLIEGAMPKISAEHVSVGGAVPTIEEAVA
jgi:hypothetical protein